MAKFTEILGSRSQKILLLICSLSALTISACASNRPPLPPNYIPPARTVLSQEEQYGHEVLTELSEKFPLDYSDPRLEQVKKVFHKLTVAAKADKHPWHVYLLKAPQIVNAAATRGNHLFVWSGLLDAIADDSELAVILSHELSHILAGHTDPDPHEEVKKILINLGAVAAGIAVSAATRNPNLAVDLGNLTASATQGIGAGLLVYPYSRGLELEADQVGLLIMAEAGYDPQRAISFWERARRDPKFSQNSEFFSTHPSSEQRVANLRKHLPYALARFNTSAIASSKNEATQKTSKWIVTASKAILYSSPNTKSKKLGEFRSNALVHASEKSNGWLEVFDPDHGYLEGKNLLPN